MIVVPTDQLIRIVAIELFIRRYVVTAIFVAVNVVGAMVALSWPESYTSSTTIFVEERNILDPLMQGAAVRTTVVDRARIASEVIFGRKVMDQLAEEMGLYTDGMSDVEKESITDKLRRRTKLLNPGRGLIRIEHSDRDSERAYRTTQKLAEIFIAASHDEKLQESTSAYQFIEKQVSEYHTKLMQAEQELKELRAANIDVGLGPGGTDGVARLTQLHTQLDQATQDLREAETRKASLERQLSGEAATSMMLSRTGQYRTRISELQAQLATAKLSFHDTHPDVVRLRHQIQDLEDAVRVEEAQRQQRGNGTADVARAQDEGVIHSPVYQQLRIELTQAQTRIDTQRAKVGEINRQLLAERNRSKQAQGGAAALNEITRDYQVNNTIYQDLLRRRENALVSMNINRERQGLGFTIQEEANLPASPSGVLFSHVIALTLFLSVLLPLGMVVAMVFADGRLRFGSVIAEQLKVPVLGTVPHLWTVSNVLRLERDIQIGVLMLAATIAVVVGVSVARALG